MLWERFKNKSSSLPSLGLSSSAYLFSALKLTHRANKHITSVCQRACVGSGVQAESVQDAGEETDIVPHLCIVPELQQSRQVPQSCYWTGEEEKINLQHHPVKTGKSKTLNLKSMQPENSNIV